MLKKPADNPMEIIIIIGLILLNGIFAMAEMSLVSSKKYKLETKNKQGNAGAAKAIELSEDPTKFLSTVQIGITLIGILLGIFSGKALTYDVEQFFSGIELFSPYAHNLAVGTVVILITYLSIVLGELLPKRIGITFPESIAVVLSRPMHWLSILTSPFVWLLTKTNNFILNILGIHNNMDNAATEQEIISLIKESTASGEIQDIEQEIVDRVFELGDRKVESLMTHRRDILFIDVSDSLEEIRGKINKEPHSAYPVTSDNNLDKVIGIIHMKDLFEGAFTRPFELSKYVKKPIFMFESTPAYKLLEEFKLQKMHYALITDEYGSIVGFITMDDVVDALVGDITQEHQYEYTIHQRDENSWLVDGQFSFIEFLRKMNLDDDHVSDHFHTIGGYIIHQHQAIPATGTIVELENLTLEVVDMDGPRIDKVLVIRKLED